MIEDTIEAINELIQLVEKFKINGVQAQIGYLNRLEEKLLEGVELTGRQKLLEYNKLFPPQGGLSDINYWHESFEIRKQVNEDINRFKLQIYNYLLNC